MPRKSILTWNHTFGSLFSRENWYHSLISGCFRRELKTCCNASKVHFYLKYTSIYVFFFKKNWYHNSLISGCYAVCAAESIFNAMFSSKNWYHNSLISGCSRRKLKTCRNASKVYFYLKSYLDPCYQVNTDDLLQLDIQLLEIWRVVRQLNPVTCSKFAHHNFFYITKFYSFFRTWTFNFFLYKYKIWSLLIGFARLSNRSCLQGLNYYYYATISF